MIFLGLVFVYSQLTVLSPFSVNSCVTPAYIKAHKSFQVFVKFFMFILDMSESVSPLTGASHPTLLQEPYKAWMLQIVGLFLVIGGCNEVRGNHDDLC